MFTIPIELYGYAVQTADAYMMIKKMEDAHIVNIGVNLHDIDDMTMDDMLKTLVPGMTRRNDDTKKESGLLGKDHQMQREFPVLHKNYTDRLTALMNFVDHMTDDDNNRKLLKALLNIWIFACNTVRFLPLFRDFDMLYESVVMFLASAPHEHYKKIESDICTVFESVIPHRPDVVVNYVDGIRVADDDKQASDEALDISMPWYQGQALLSNKLRKLPIMRLPVPWNKKDPHTRHGKPSYNIWPPNKSEWLTDELSFEMTKNNCQCVDILKEKMGINVQGIIYWSKINSPNQVHFGYFDSAIYLIFQGYRGVRRGNPLEYFRAMMIFSEYYQNPDGEKILCRSVDENDQKNYYPSETEYVLDRILITGHNDLFTLLTNLPENIIACGDIWTAQWSLLNVFGKYDRTKYIGIDYDTEAKKYYKNKQIREKIIEIRNKIVQKVNEAFEKGAITKQSLLEKNRYNILKYNDAEVSHRREPLYDEYWRRKFYDKYNDKKCDYLKKVLRTIIKRKNYRIRERRIEDLRNRWREEGIQTMYEEDSMSEHNELGDVVDNDQDINLYGNSGIELEDIPNEMSVDDTELHELYWYDITKDGQTINVNVTNDKEWKSINYELHAIFTDPEFKKDGEYDITELIDGYIPRYYMVDDIENEKRKSRIDTRKEREDTVDDNEPLFGTIIGGSKKQYVQKYDYLQLIRSHRSY